ncbi:PAS domain S-box-containing protein [Mucilaginibacter pineti]|uniref:PAS domain S-box-containing protein n=1 Tax=Mucilaginibacter pineti TaxID=1391627 RepID=A0A1G6XCS1_9SPHI|nr:PAS domain-containing protein [Mucilaginibacter pineti]SDD75871.1 PAS domain S-box-containing protein [Mucilaginibacter pineti]
MSFDPNSDFFEIALNVTEHTEAMLAYWDKNLLCRYANKATADWFAVTPYHMINKSYLSDILGSLFEAQLPYINGALAGKIQVFDQVIHLYSGKAKNMRVTYHPHYVEGEVKGFYAHMTDISPLNTQPIDDETRVKKLPEFLTQSNRLLENVTKSLNDNVFTAFPSISVLARKHFVSESKLKRDFKQTFGRTIFSYYRFLQMEIADKYITEKRCNKNQMAVMLNFSNPSNFSACYHKYLAEKLAGNEVNNTQKDNNEHYKMLIEQAPITIAMFNTQMQFIAASKKWIIEYQLENIDFIGECLYDVWPATKKKCEKLHLYCLKGHIQQCDGLFLKKNNGTNCWLKWNIHPWFTTSGAVGGLFVHTEDISKIKDIEKDNKLAAKILKNASTLSKTGTWTKDQFTNTIQWDNVIQSILEVPEYFVPEVKAVLMFFKQGRSQILSKKVLKEAFKYGTPFNIEVDMITAKGNSKRIRIIGYPDFFDDECKRISGTFQDITPVSPV